MTTPDPSTQELTLVVPCYNEAARLDGAAFVAALERLPWLHLCFVNDGSTDGTAGMLDGLVRRHPNRMSVLTLERNAGKAEAVRLGLQGAMTKSPLCGFWDADLAAPLDEVEYLRSALLGMPELEWVFGIRLRSLGRHIQRKAGRHYLGRVFATVASSMLVSSVYDSQCGAKIFRSTAALREVVEEPFRSRWVFDLEMLVRLESIISRGTARQLEDVVLEMPLRRWSHRTGSKVRGRDFIQAAIDLVRIRAWRRRNG